jgi:hypothetical protein
MGISIVLRQDKLVPDVELRSPHPRKEITCENRGTRISRRPTSSEGIRRRGSVTAGKSTASVNADVLMRKKRDGQYKRYGECSARYPNRSNDFSY